MKRKGDPQDAALTRISKDMSRILRHAPPPGEMDSEGWVRLPALLKALRQRATEDIVRQITEENDKKRFVLDDSTDPPRIRAAQGHTVALEKPVLQLIERSEEVPVAVHVTSSVGWQAMQSSGQLLRMKRTHIHFATAPHHLRKNGWACIYLKLKLQEAMTAGHSFHLSTNGVLLCEGPLPISLMEEVQLTELPDTWQQPFATTLTTAAKAAVMAQNKQSSTNAQAPDTEVEP